jgi:hypothetical protein
MTITELQRIQELLGKITNICKDLDGLDVIAAKEVRSEIHYIVNEIADNLQKQVIKHTL